MTIIEQFFGDLRGYLEGIDRKKDAILFRWIESHWPRDISPNHLTVARIIIGCFLFIFIFNFKNTNGFIIFPLFVIGALTDLLDGAIARCFDKKTKFGIVMDPIADRILLLPVAIYSLLETAEFLLFFLLISEIANGLLSLVGGGKNLFAGSNIFGKAKMMLQSVVFIAILLFWPNPPHVIFIYLLWVSAICLALSIVLKVNELRHA